MPLSLFVLPVKGLWNAKARWSQSLLKMRLKQHTGPGWNCIGEVIVDQQKWPNIEQWSWLALSQSTQSLEYDDSSRFEYYQLLLLKLCWIMSVGRLQSKCYDCASRADSKTPESHLKSSCKPEGFLDELRSDLDGPRVDTVVRPW